MNDGHAEAGSGDGYDGAFDDGFAVTVARRDGEWVVAEFDDDFENLDTSIGAVRGLRSEGAAFALINVEEDYLVIVRPGPSRTRVLISDATMAVDDDFAAEVLDTAGIDIPDIDPDELDNIDGWADGDFRILEDVGVSEEVMSVLIDDSAADPSDVIDRIADELGFIDELDRALH
ncbi:tRNA adenosine deaminase-associated protein [Corynebacterium appendicis]|uniref:tRNA adenosine deaminase-associated protein n=1 Tax=Corynebacterium appendicis TaxID=163202 RepID=UPI00223B2631|nr:tRNA adenosine deaminase-associated protein [Corynebacterium appendicis]MCT1684538.1 tRNA adenosine deaminase-associated protein [Corynebacterium appendicis]MDK8626570.1 tRNA adenosine deaminase-associated protein [Corynebacterium appendicis]